MIRFLLLLLALPPCPGQTEIRRAVWSDSDIAASVVDCTRGPGVGTYWHPKCWFNESVYWGIDEICAYSVDYHLDNPECRVGKPCLPCSSFDIDKDGDVDLFDYSEHQRLKQRSHDCP